MKRGRFLIQTLIVVAVIPFASATLSMIGCGDDLSESSTAGQRVALNTRVESGDDLTRPMLNAQGWTIALRRVLVSTGAMYYFDGDPPELALRRKAGQRPQRWFGVRAAHAHPGHYQAGNAMGQMLEPASFDLMAGPVALSKGEGVTGAYRSASLFFQSPAVGQHADLLGDRVVLVEGTAEKAGEARKFRASASASELTNASGNAAVEACVFAPVDVGSDGTVVLRIKPSIWLDQIDFSDVPPSDGDFVDLPTTGPAHQAFTLLGVNRASAYSFSFEGP